MVSAFRWLAASILFQWRKLFLSDPDKNRRLTARNAEKNEGSRGRRRGMYPVVSVALLFCPGASALFSMDHASLHLNLGLRHNRDFGLEEDPSGLSG